MGRTGVSGICADSLCAGVSTEADSDCVVVSLVALVLGADAGAVKELLVKFLNI